MQQDGGSRGPGDSRLRHVRAAQLRARAFKSGIGKSALGSLFLLGAFAYAFAPDRHSGTSLTWMAALVVLSTFHVGLGLHTIARARRRAQRLWLPMTLAWGILATGVLYILLRR